MIVTTAGRTDERMISLAKQIAEDLSTTYIERRKSSVEEIQQKYNHDVLVVGKNRLELHTLNKQEPFFFHPNSAMFRIKRLMNREDDPLIKAAGLKEGMSFLDCTLGLGSDSIVASFIVGNQGKAVGIEGNELLSYLVKTGLHTWDSGIENFNQAMQRVNVINKDHLDYLKSCSSKSFDIVYFDPMFEEAIDESNGISALKNIAVYKNITNEVIEEARRVAIKKVILKDHWKSERFDRFGFSVLKRKTAKFHFGALHLE
ncbi:class I SAM-dependent methyltransferase [Cytobacillus suaedae]|nr:class I SAM-dependent methyltransferase [Cytobacillus suaedae]